MVGKKIKALGFSLRDLGILGYGFAMIEIGDWGYKVSVGFFFFVLSIGEDVYGKVWVWLGLEG